MSNSPNIKLMNCSCFDRKRLRGLTPRRLDSPAYTLPRHPRRRLLVTLCHSHGVLPQSIFGKHHLATDHPNGYTGRQVRPPHRHGHQPKCCDRHRYGILFPIPYIHSVAMERAHIQQGTAHQVLAAPCLHVREVRPMVALYRSSFDFGRRSYYFGGGHHPCHHLQHGLPGLQLRPSPPLYFRTSYGLLRLCAQDAPHDQSVGPSHFHQKRNGTDTPAPRTRQMPNPVVAPPFDDRSLAHCRRRPLHLPPTARSSDCRSGMACLLACRDLPLLAIGLPQNEKERPQIPICPQSEKRMNFKENKPIYLQIADRICDEILQGRYAENDRIPSVRDYAATVEVNANTAMRSYDFLQSHSVIRMQRGIGYFVEPGASERIRSFRRESFMNEELYDFFRQARSIGITAEELETLYRQYLSDTSDTMSNL